MTRHVGWQAALAVAGVALVFVILALLASGQETVEVPAAGGTFVEAVLVDAQAINPILVQANPVDRDLSALVFDGLTLLDATGQVSGALAVDWSVSGDGTTYEFRLRQGITWSDGAPFTAADVLFTVQAIQDPDFRGSPALHGLWLAVKAERVDDYTVRFVLTEPFPSFLYYTTIGLLPAHVLSDVPAADLPTDDFSTKSPIGTGRFKVESVSPRRVVLAKNERYWGRKPFLERIEFRSFADDDGVLAAYQRGDVQGFHPSRSTGLAELAGFPNLRLASAESSGYGAVLLNLRRETLPFFATRDVRQALMYALDRPALIDLVLEGQGLLADSPIPPMLWAYDPNVRQYAYDPERASGLLDATGWSDFDGDRIRDRDGTNLAFELLTSDDQVMAYMAEQVAVQWRAIGADVTVREVSADLLPNLIRGRDFDAVLSEMPLTADPDPYPLWHSTQVAEPGQNYTGFANEEADRVMELARATLDPKRRAELFGAFQRIFGEELPAILLYYPVYTYAVDVQVEQVQLSPLFSASDRFRNIADWYMKTSRVRVNETQVLDNSMK